MARIRIRPSRQDFQLTIQENDNGVTVTCPSYPQGYNILKGTSFAKDLNALVTAEKAKIDEAIADVQTDMQAQFDQQAEPFDNQVKTLIEKFSE